MKSSWLTLWILVVASALAPAAERSWDGGATAGDINWGTGANWNGDTAIAAGDLLSFQNGVGNNATTVNNNLTAWDLLRSDLLHEQRQQPGLDADGEQHHARRGRDQLHRGHPDAQSGPHPERQPVVLHQLGQRGGGRGDQ
ncbi:hypothetical protein [Verrucomicrobium sp. BvORR106]|uniref:hypothetical protein n=1 Tax=Verrucomicrobium sp. BvORR106 TaxID=1403819 RepID=UPI0022410167|nr:hypothetical protein [Verrucomicrobium sp. BvORR106]